MSRKVQQNLLHIGERPIGGVLTRLDDRESGKLTMGQDHDMPEKSVLGASCNKTFFPHFFLPADLNISHEFEFAIVHGHSQ